MDKEGGTPTGIESVDARKCDVESKVRFRSLEAIQAEQHSGDDGHHVLSAVDKMRKHVLCIIVTSDTLQSTPDRRQGVEEAKNPGVTRVTHTRLIPLVGVQTEEQSNVLDSVSTPGNPARPVEAITYTRSIGQRAPNITEKEISELDGIQAR